jgi:REP element-mobilizing transposase RayT
MAPGIPSLRKQRCFRALQLAFKEGNKKFGFRLVHFTVQGNHVHLLVEVDDKAALSRGVGALSIRIARGINRELQRKGRVFGDRYHARALKTPREVRNALRYVLLNGPVHASRGGKRLREPRFDPCSSAAEFTGWKADVIVRHQPVFGSAEELIAPPRTWLLRVGWQRAGPALDPSVQ